HGVIGWRAPLPLGGRLARCAMRGRPRAWRQQPLAAPAASASPPRVHVSPRRVGWSLAILGALIFSKYFYLASLSSYYTFFLIEKFYVSVRTAQFALFVFLAAVAVGTILGGPIGDRIGRKLVIWVSILGVLPFTLLLPYASFFWTPV